MGKRTNRGERELELDLSLVKRNNLHCSMYDKQLCLLSFQMDFGLLESFPRRLFDRVDHPRADYLSYIKNVRSSQPLSPREDANETT